MIVCNVCGGFINNMGFCDYCGNIQRILCKKATSYVYKADIKSVKNIKLSNGTDFDNKSSNKSK